MAGRDGWLGLLITAGCVVSLAGWEPLRRVEQVLAPAAAITDGLVRPLVALPSTRTPAEWVSSARAAWTLYERELFGSQPVAREGHETLLAPVVGADERRRTLTLHVPRNGVPEGALVTHRGLLLGFVSGLDGDLAEVSLLGREDLRAVAGEWRVAPGSRPVHFLLQGGEGRSLVASPSSSVAPPLGQLAWTRDVAGLGDSMPPGLLLGRVVEASDDRPGGATPRSPRPVVLQPLVDPMRLGVVVVEVRAGTQRQRRAIEGRALPSCGTAQRLRVQVGLGAGVQTGDIVVQDGVLVGVVVTAGPLSCEVERRVPPGEVLVLDGAEVVPCRQAADGWPEGWAPQTGRLVAGGHVDGGGFLAGVVGQVGARRFDVALAGFDPEKPVAVLRR